MKLNSKYYDSGKLLPNAIAATFDKEISEMLIDISRRVDPNINKLGFYARSSSAGESHPHPLTEPDVNLSAHPALIVQPVIPDILSANGQINLAP